MVPGMSVSSYRKYTIVFDLFGLLLFIGITVFGICMFCFDIPSSLDKREIIFFSLCACGILVYVCSMCYQISKCRREKIKYTPLQ